MARIEIASALETQPRRTDGYLPLEDYAAIGDGRALALVGSDGSIDWLCLPELDSPSVFGSLLDPAEGGSFALAPSIPYEVKRAYLPDTNVLQSEFSTAEGTVRVTEAMTVDTTQNAPWRELVRRAHGVSGAVPMEWRLRPRFGYGQEAREPTRVGDALVYRYQRLQVAIKGWDAGEPQVKRGVAAGNFEIGSAQEATLVMVASDDVSLPSPERADVAWRLQATVELWREWIGRCTYEGPWQEAVRRSLLAIRLLADARTGAITAAGTTSLPEVIGGKRNYDYRYGWVRDLSFTVDALLRVGMEELSHSSVGWLLGAVHRTHPRVDPVYSLTGEVVRSQEPLPLTGYRGSSPVHVGNNAGGQLQLGGFGDLIETVWRYVQTGHILAPATGERIADSADLLCAIWRNQDAGLWELGDYAHYATSKISCWTALDRLLDLAAKGQVPARHIDRWRSERERVREFIEGQLWNETRGSYLMKAGSDALDCGVLLAARRGYTDPGGARMNQTIDAIGRELRADGPLFYRYSGMQEQENAFLACSFWMAEALALAGRLDEAAEIMDGMVSLGHDLGLYTEEMDPSTREMRGNLPQALTHLALVSAAALFAERARR
jgi:GH15 family glucan-1,4-alpha-glucosidase